LNLFQQSTGIWTASDGKVTQGYAGLGAGKNNPAMQDRKGIGPLPRGKYTGTELRDPDPVVGAYAIALTPDPSNNMYGRNSFFLHGDSVEHPGEASHGCIVMPREVREAFWKGDDHVIVVYE
jgi:hypothetical protein